MRTCFLFVVNNPIHALNHVVASYLDARGSHGSGVPESTPAGSCIFLSDPHLESKICEKVDLDPESLFNFSSSRSLHGHL